MMSNKEGGQLTFKIEVLSTRKNTANIIRITFNVRRCKKKKKNNKQNYTIIEVHKCSTASD